MVNSTVPRWRNAVILAFIVASGLWLSLSPSSAHAQDGAGFCPYNTDNAGVLHGSFFADVETCLATGDYSYVVDDNQDVAPCDQYARLWYEGWADFGGVNPNDYSFFYAANDDLNMQNQARFRLYFWFPDYVGTTTAPPPLDGRFYVNYHWKTGRPISSVQGQLSDLPTHLGEFQTFALGRRYYTIYEIDVTFDTILVPEGTAWGGFVQFAVQGLNGQPLAYDLAASSVQFAPTDNLFPPMCSFNGYQISSPTPTPTGTLEPTPATTPQPTAPAATLQPTPSPTAIQWGTVPAPPPPTAPAIPTAGVIQFPAVTLPTLAPIVTATPAPTILAAAATQEAGLVELDLQADYVLTRWAQPIEQSFNELSLENTEGISTTYQSVTVAAERIGYPFRFAKSIQFYLPSTWPFFAVLFACVVIVLSTHFLRLALALISLVLSFIKTVWEAIPFN